jgi:electron transfer flavoprotein beta subunit
MYQIIVCIKAVPDLKLADRIRIDPVSKTLKRSEVPLVLNPLDKHAMEAALWIKETAGAFLIVVSMGPPEAGNIVKECLALGADQGILLSDRAFAGADTYATAFTLARSIEKIGRFDLILCGMASSDGGTEWVGPQVATFLGVPVVTMIEEFAETQETSWIVKSCIENGHRLMQVKLPALFTVTRKLNSPRTLSFSGIIKARNKQIICWSAEDLGVTGDMLGLSGSPTRVSAMTTRSDRRQVEIINGTSEEKAEILVQKLADAGLV